MDGVAFARGSARWVSARHGFTTVCVADAMKTPPDFPPPETHEDAAAHEAAGHLTQTSHVLVQRGEHAASLAYGMPFVEDGEVDQVEMRKRIRRLEAKLYRDEEAPFAKGEAYVSHEEYLAWLDSCAWKGRRARRPRKDGA